MLWTLAELVVCSKVRVTRQLATAGKVKGKVVLDLSEAAMTASRLDGILDRLVDVLAEIDRQWSDIAPWPTRKAAG